jgi:uncharacterized protein YndB with AHSA1/START domain
MAENQQQVSVSRVIDAPPSAIFAVLTDAEQHPVIDGSGTVKATTSSDGQPELGSKFGMKMRMGLPYRMSNEVVEFEQDRLIAWQHLGHHRWRYELEPVDGGTEVTETFDWSTARSPKFLELMGYPKKHPEAMTTTLERLDAHVTDS